MKKFITLKGFLKIKWLTVKWYIQTSFGRKSIVKGIEFVNKSTIRKLRKGLLIQDCIFLDEGGIEILE